MSPILVRPVREQLEHDRIIRLLQTKFRRRYEAGMNPGAEQNIAVGAGAAAMYPDLVLQSQDRGRKLQGLVEVETGESVNHLEALAQWAHFARARVPFHLYVPAGMVDVARRLCEDNQIHVGEIWSYHTVGDQVRFTMVHRHRESASPPVRRALGAADTSGMANGAHGGTTARASGPPRPAAARKAGKKKPLRKRAKPAKTKKKKKRK